jgi:two-component system, LytTR family, response regulator
MISCVIIDDEQLAINVIEMYVKKIPSLQLIGTATNPLAGIELVRANKVDVVFLDIQMDEMNGIDVMKIIGPGTKVVFCTAFPEFAVDSYDLDAIDYLMKPIPFNRFLRAVHRISNNLLAQSTALVDTIPNDYLFIKTEQKGKMIKVNLDDIDYIEGMSNYIAVHRSLEKILVYSTMKEVEERLPKSQFMRVHKSYIVALKQIMSIENGDIVMRNRSEKIPLSHNYKDIFMERMKNKLLQN